MRKFDSQSDEGIFLGYSSTSKAYRVYNKRTMKVMETVNVVINEFSNFGSKKFSEEIPKEILPQELASPSTPYTLSVVEDSTNLSSRIKLNHPLEVIVGNMNELTLRKRTVDKCVANFVSYSCYL